MSVRMVCRIDSQRSCSSKQNILLLPIVFRARGKIARFWGKWLLTPLFHCRGLADSALILGQLISRGWTAHPPRHTSSARHLPTRNPLHHRPGYYVEASRCYSGRRFSRSWTKKKVCDLYTTSPSEAANLPAKAEGNSPRFWADSTGTEWYSSRRTSQLRRKNLHPLHYLMASSHRFSSASNTLVPRVFRNHNMV